MGESNFVKLAREALRLEDELTKVRSERDELDIQARAVREYLSIVCDKATEEIKDWKHDRPGWDQLQGRLELAKALAQKIDAGDFEEPQHYAIVGPGGSVGYTVGELGKKRALERDPDVKFRPITKEEYGNYARDED